MSKQPLISVDEALTRILSTIDPLIGKQRTPLHDARGGILAEDLLAPCDQPPHRNSAMDGYALRGEDLPAEGKATLDLVGRSFAGEPWDGALQAGQSIRIMTGAVVPDGADTVIMQERVERDGDRITIGAGHQAGENVRHPGEDYRRGDRILAAGTRLGSAELALAASIGLDAIYTRRRPRVAICSTGDELKLANAPLGPGDIYDSNRALLTAELRQLPLEIIDLGIIADDREQVRRTFEQAAQFADMLITSGGVSVGEADYIKEILDEIGQVELWRIAIKPGKPLAYGALGKTRFFGLPGNPVSALITLRQFVLPALKRMGGAHPHPPLRFLVPLKGDLRKRPGRREYQRGILAADDSGAPVVRGVGAQGSHLLTSLAKANCLIILPEESSGAQDGEPVLVEPMGDRL